MNPIKADELLKRVVDENDPWVTDDYGRTTCFYCIEDSPNHSDDCLYDAILEYLKREKYVSDQS